MTPCTRCNRLGWVTEFESNPAGAISICPDCKGQKGFPDPDKQRIALGICKFCNQQISFPAHDTPCSLGRSAHVIPGLGGGTKA